MPATTQDVLEKEPELVLPGGSVCSSETVYLVICDLCKAGMAARAERQAFLPELKFGVSCLISQEGDGDGVE